MKEAWRKVPSGNITIENHHFQWVYRLNGHFPYLIVLIYQMVTVSGLRQVSLLSLPQVKQRDPPEGEPAAPLE